MGKYIAKLFTVILITSPVWLIAILGIFLVRQAREDGVQWVQLSPGSLSESGRVAVNPTRNKVRYLGGFPTMYELRSDAQIIMRRSVTCFTNRGCISGERPATNQETEYFFVALHAVQ